MGKPFPVPTPDSRPFWNGLAEHKVMLKYCADCSTLFHYPRIVCPKCLSSELRWREGSGTGFLYTYTISRRPTHPLFADEIPQYLAVVELDDGPRMTSTLVNVAENNIEIGMRLVPVFEHHQNEKITLLRFQPEQESLRISPSSAPTDEQPNTSLLTEESLSYIGKTGKLVTGYPISEHEIRRFCYAIDDLNPVFLDASARPDGVVVPPMFFSIPFDTDAPLAELAADGTPLVLKGAIPPPLKAKRKIFGGYQVEFFQEMRPGDVLTRQRKNFDIYERSGKNGSSVYVLTEVTYTNQRGEKVAVELITIINR